MVCTVCGAAPCTCPDDGTLVLVACAVCGHPRALGAASTAVHNLTQQHQNCLAAVAGAAGGAVAAGVAAGGAAGGAAGVAAGVAAGGAAGVAAGGAAGVAAGVAAGGMEFDDYEAEPGGGNIEGDGGNADVVGGGGGDYQVAWKSTMPSGHWSAGCGMLWQDARPTRTPRRISSTCAGRGWPRWPTTSSPRDGAL